MFPILGICGALLGLFVSLQIYYSKKHGKSLACPRKAPCEAVVRSTYATTLGVRNEVIGIGFYIATAVCFLVAALMPNIVTAPYILILLVLGLCGIFASVYFLIVQAFILRKWCLWCLGSTLATVLIAYSLWYVPTEALHDLLLKGKAWVLIAHNIGFILGLGAATITDIFFFRFLKDGVISQEEKNTMDTLSNVIWIGLVILIISGILLYIPEQIRLAASSKFLLKTIVVSVVTINGVLLNILIAPRMMELSLKGTPSATRFRNLAFALGGISIVSWYSAFLLGSLRAIPISLDRGLLLYGTLLLFVVIGSQIYARYAIKKGIVPPGENK